MAKLEETPPIRAEVAGGCVGLHSRLPRPITLVRFRIVHHDQSNLGRDGFIWLTLPLQRKSGQAFKQGRILEAGADQRP